MTEDITKSVESAPEVELFCGDDWFDPLEAGVRERIRMFIEELDTSGNLVTTTLRRDSISAG